MINFDSEKCLEQFLYENMDLYAEEIHGFRGGQWIYKKQVALGRYGICDILGFRVVPDIHAPIMEIQFNLIELKNTIIKIEHFAQIARYKAFFDDLFVETPHAFEFKASLIGLKTFNNAGDLCYLAHTIDWLNVFEMEISPVTGLSLSLFSGHGRNRTDAEQLNLFADSLISEYRGNGNG